MGNEIIGKLYLNMRATHYGVADNPIFHGYPLFDYVSTNRWPFIEVNSEECQRVLRGGKNEHPQIIKDLCQTLISDPPINFFREDSDNRSRILPSLFSPYHCFLIDIFVLIGIKMGKLDIDDVSCLNSEWTQVEKNEILPALLEIDQEINDVIDYLCENGVRISAVCERPMLPFPDFELNNELKDSSMTIERYHNWRKLQFECYSPTIQIHPSYE